MSRIARTGILVSSVSMTVLFVSGLAFSSRADESVGRDLPPALVPLEYLVGRWKGTATPKASAQSFRGWPETHAWAWTFTRGKPTGMSVAIEGGKVLARGKLTFDPTRKRYRLEGTAIDPPGAPIVFEGTLDASGKLLKLDQVGTGQRESLAADAGAVRLTFRPNASFIRYTMGVEHRDAGAVRFRRTIEVGLTREGEQLAGGGTAAETIKCIVTGGAASMTVSYQGRAFPICCTGCRDEFNDNPGKYIKKASLMAEAAGKAASASAKPGASRVARFDDAFSGDVPDAPEMKPAGPAPPRSSPKATVGKGKTDGDANADADAGSAVTPAAKKPGTRSAGASTSSDARAASRLRIAQNLEKSGKPEAALANYRQIVKDFPDTPAAKTARRRIKDLQPP